MKEPIPMPLPGELTFSQDVFRSIAETVVENIDDVRLGLRPRGGIIDRIRRKFGEGVRIEQAERSVTYHVPVVIRASGDVREVCRQIQRKLSSETRYMTGFPQVSVDVSILGIE